MLYFIVTRYLFDPLAWVLYVLIAAVVAGQVYKNTELQKGLVIAAVAALFALMVIPFDQMLARPLEDQYPRPALPAHVDGIVVLDSGDISTIFAARGVTGPNPSALRMIAGAELARRFPNAKFVYSGTTGNSARRQAEGLRAREAFLLSLGLAPGRTIFEHASRDTGENLVNSKALAIPKDGETWMLVTSAVHMPRSMAIARAIGWKMVPWPSDYISTPNGAGVRLGFPSEGLLGFDAALHEWIGMATYQLTGRLTGRAH